MVAAPLLFSLFTCAFAAPLGPARSQAPEGFWDHWGDGKAELASYALTQPRYGESREGRAVLVFVTEDMDRESRVKSDRSEGRFPVIKLNEVRDFRTGIYDYNVLQSSFLPLDGSAPLGQPAKLSLSVQEWCGHVYEQWVVDPGEARVDRHSYFEGEADQRKVVQVPPGAVFADGWPILVRGLAGELVVPGQTVEVAWLAPLLQFRFAHSEPSFTTATLTRSEGTVAVEVPAGTFDAWSVKVEEAGGRTSTWWVEAAPPHKLVKWEVSDGESAGLTHVIREPYWKMNRAEDLGRRADIGL